MKRHLNESAMQQSNGNFDCSKMKTLISDNATKKFSERFREWLKIYTQPAKEKIWLDIESYH